MKKKKLLAISLTTAMAFSVFTGCGSNEKEADAKTTTASEAAASASEEETHEQVSLTITYAGGDETTVATTQKLLNEFDEKYDWITLIQDASSSGSYDDYVATLANTGQFPDVIEMRQTENYAEADYLAPIPDSLVELIAEPQPIDGTVYTIPMTGSTPNGILYNVDYLASLGYEDIPAVVTWDTFIEMLDAIVADGKMEPIAVGGADQWHMGFWFNKFYNDYVIKTNEDFIADVYAGTASWTDEEPRQVVEAMVELWQYVGKGWASTGDADLATLLVNEQAAMYYSGTWMFTTINNANPDFNYSYFGVTDKEGWMSIVGGATSSGWALSAEAAENPNKVEAFELLIEFLLTPENYVQYLESVGSVYATTYAVTYDGGEAMDKAYTIMEEADDARLMWNNQIGELALPDGFRNFVYKTVQEVLAGATDIDTAMQTIQKYWEECVATSAE